jgi:hypothetical protein
MDYIAQYYKNRTIQLQQELEQLTETYEYRLNEAPGLGSLIRRAFGFAGDDVGRVVEREAIQAVAAPPVPVLSAAEREAAAAAARAAAQAARETFAREVREALRWVTRNIVDIPPSRWVTWKADLNPAQREAFNRLFGHSQPNPRNINLSNGSQESFISVRNGNKDYIFFWDDIADGWKQVGKNQETPFGNTGIGFIPAGKSRLQASNMVDTIDPNMQYTQLASTKVDTGPSNGSGLGSNGSGLGSVAALYMSYDPRAVSRKINYITENYYRN